MILVCMAASDLSVSSRRVVTPEGVRPASILISDGLIEAVESYAPRLGSSRCVEAGDAIVMPGLVDTHVHVNEPGREDWEGFETAGRAAAAGGVTTIVDMPLNSIPVTTRVSALRAKLRAARDRCAVDYGFWGGVVPGNREELAALLDGGVLGFKCFLVDSGLEDFRAVGEEDLRAAMKCLAGHGAVLLAHAEAPGAIRAKASGDPRRYEAYLATRPWQAEMEAIELLIRVCRETGCRVHIVHLSAAEPLEALRLARRAGLPISVETCPHYLVLSSELVPEGATLFKCAPPIRDEANRERLWEGLTRGLIDLIVSDHSPCLPEMKRVGTGDFLAAWGGIASLGLSLPVLWPEARRRGVDLGSLARWLCEGPARLAGLGGRKGRIEPGYDADLVIWDPSAVWTVGPERLHFRHKRTAYEGRAVRGEVLQTLVGGRSVFERGRLVGDPGGRWIRGHAA
ncbi:MAG: allantoinase AllB [Gemmatimonadota bacterium]